MLRPFLVLFICCVMLSVVQTADTEDELAELNIISLYCGPKEIYKCVGCPPEDSCYDRYRIGCPIEVSSCNPLCVCKEGFIRKTLDSECIPKEQCGVPCGLFEYYSECKQFENQTCSSITNPVKQNYDDKESCTPGCSCRDGYYRADKDSPCLHRCLCAELKDTPDCVW